MFQPNYQLNFRTQLKKIVDICIEIEFYIKVALGCAILQQVFYRLLHDINLNFISQVLVYWMVGLISFYAIGFLIEKVIKNNEELTAKLNIRIKPVKKQPFPAFTAQDVFLGGLKSLIAALFILYVAPEVDRSNGFLLNFGWFLMRIIAFDFGFYVVHWLFHRKPLLKIHLKHHEFIDTSSFVTGHTTLIEYIIVSVIIESIPILIFGYDITQLCAWVMINTAYSLEGHSSLSIFFISSDFHDLHHTSFKKNYGIQGFWDIIFNTSNPPTNKPGIMFPASLLKAQVTEWTKEKSPV